MSSVSIRIAMAIAFSVLAGCSEDAVERCERLAVRAAEIQYKCEGTLEELLSGKGSIDDPAVACRETVKHVFFECAKHGGGQ